MLDKLPRLDKKILTSENILNHTTEGEIFRHFFGEFRIGKMYNSPLRSNDNSPSFNIYVDSNLNLRFKDWGLPEDSSGDCFQFVMLLYNLKYREALKFISDQMNLGLFTGGRNSSISPKKVIYEGYKDLSAELTMESRVRLRDWADYDYKYWSQYHLSYDILERFGIHPCKELWYRKHGKGWKKLWINTPDNPMYVFKIKNYALHNVDTVSFGDVGIKVYRPYQSEVYGRDSTYKWFTGLKASSYIQGLEYLPASGELLFITSSLKDVCTLYNIGISAIAPNNETSLFDKDLMDYLKKRWNRIVVNYDSDNTGVGNSIILTKNYELEYWNIPKSYEVKDVSDFVKDNSLEELKYIINNRLKIF